MEGKELFKNGYNKVGYGSGDIAGKMLCLHSCPLSS